MYIAQCWLHNQPVVTTRWVCPHANYWLCVHIVNDLHVTSSSSSVVRVDRFAVCWKLIVGLQSLTFPITLLEHLTNGLKIDKVIQLPYARSSQTQNTIQLKLWGGGGFNLTHSTLCLERCSTDWATKAPQLAGLNHKAKDFQIDS